MTVLFAAWFFAAVSCAQDFSAGEGSYHPSGVFAYLSKAGGAKRLTGVRLGVTGPALLFIKEVPMGALPPICFKDWIIVPEVGGSLLKYDMAGNLLSSSSCVEGPASSGGRYSQTAIFLVRTKFPPGGKDFIRELVVVDVGGEKASVKWRKDVGKAVRGVNAGGGIVVWSSDGAQRIDIPGIEDGEQP